MATPSDRRLNAEVADNVDAQPAGGGVPTERARHEALGAIVVRITPDCVTLRAPTGQEYCITRCHPGHGRLP